MGVAVAVRAIFFDAGGTLFTERSSRAAIYARAFARHGRSISESSMAEAMAHAHATLPFTIAGQPRYTDEWFRAFIVEVARRVGGEVSLGPLSDELFATFSDPGTFRVFDDVWPTLTALRARRPSLTLGVISNWSPRLERLLESLRLDFFRPILASASIGVEKPDVRLFAEAAAQAGVPATECVHIGDHLERDLRGARAAGMRALLLERERERKEDDQDTIASLTEVLSRLGSSLA